MRLNETIILDCDNYEYSSGDIAIVLYNSLLFLFLMAGISFFYSGLTKIGSSITILSTPFLATVVVSLQWWLLGYSVAFSKTSGPFLGDFSNAFLNGVYKCPYPGVPLVPELVFSFYQAISAVLPVSILLGAIAERGRILPAIFFILVWTTFVYDIICSWSMNPNGWSFRMGG